MPDVALTGDDIRNYLLELAEALPKEPLHTVLVVGGSLLALHALRASTHDVDSVLALDNAVREAATVVAKEHGLLPHWLNDNARPFRPQSLREQDCDVLLEHRGLKVLGAPLAEVFLMKLDASRVRSSDYDDMVALWPYCGFTSAQQVVDRYYDAYPLASSDAFLVAFISDIAKASAGSSPKA